MRVSAAGLQADIVLRSDIWANAPNAEAVARQAVETAASLVADQLPHPAEFALVLSDDAHIRTLNHQWRGKDTATNVLSFPAQNLRESPDVRHLGDVIIAYETVFRESSEQGKPFNHHLAHLAVHGFLHLLGYDHQDDDSAAQMERLECRTLAALGIPDPYGATG